MSLRLPLALGALAVAPLLAQQQPPAPPAPAPAPTPAAPIRPGDSVGRISLVDEQPIQVVSLLEKITGRIALRSGELPPVKISFNSGRALTRAEAETALESLLALNGIAAFAEGDTFLKVVPSAANKSAAGEAPPLYLDSVAGLPPSDRFVGRLFTLRNIPYATIDAAVQAMVNKPRGASAVAMPAANSVLVTDSLINVQRIEAVIAKADTASKVIFLPLKHTRAAEVVKQLKSLQASGLKTGFAGDVGFEAGDVTNQIMAVTNPANEARIREIIAGIDTENAPVTRSELIPLRHAEAADVVQIVQNLASGTSGAVGPTAATNTGARTSSRTSRNSRLTNSSRTTSSGGQVYISQNYNYDPNKKGATDEDASFSPYFTAVADSRANAIVVYGTDRDMRQVKDIVSKVDVQLQQVRIEAVIVEVTLGSGQASGFETLGLGLYTGTQGVPNGRHNGDVNFNTAMPGLPSQSGAGKSPFSVTGSLKDFSLEMIFNKSRNDDRVKLLSAPVIVTSHNKPAVIKVGQRQPIITGTTSSTVTAGTTTSQVDYRDIGLEVNLTPRIGANGVVELDVTQKNESIIGNTTIDGNQQPIIGNREAQSYITAANGETVVLAGLQSYNETKTKGKVWLLGDIPWLGEWLFQPETSLMQKTELIIFLKPHVLTATDAVPAADTPGLRPGSLTKEPATGYLRNGVYTEITTPSTYFEKQDAERKAAEEKAAAEAAAKKAEKKEPMRGMHD